MADIEHARPPAGFEGIRQAPDVPAKMPHARHSLTGIHAGSFAKHRNSFTEPWVDVRADIDAINRGEGYFNARNRRTWINGRIYGMHENGTTWPESGTGVIQINRGTFNALTIIQGYNGLNERSEHQIAHEKGITIEDRELAIRIWRSRQEALGT